MPIMSSTATAAASAPTQQKSDIKPIGICLSTNSNIEIPSATTANLTSNTRNVTNSANPNNLYTATTTVSATGQFQMGPLSVMVAKFTPNPSISSNRQQTVILQPRINTTRTTALQVNPSRGPTVLSSQNLSSSLTSTTSSISVRTRVLGTQAHQNSTLPVLNLSTVTNTVTSSNSSSTNTVKQMLSAQKYITASGNVETVNLVMANPNETRNIRTNSSTNDIKSNMFTVHNLNKVNVPKSVISGSTIVTGQPKMISLNNSGQSNANVSQRLGILGTNVGTSGKPALINLAKSFIITSPNATLTASGATIANMVSISSANFVPTGQPTKISVTPNNIITGANRQVVTTIVTQSNITSSKPTIYTVATTNVNVLNQVASLSTTTAVSGQHSISYQNMATAIVSMPTPVTLSPSLSNSKPTILATNLSPVKHPLQQTPSSPRPRILSRKRLQSDSPMITIKATNGTIPLVSNQSMSNIVDQKPLQGKPLTNNSVDSQPNSIIKSENINIINAVNTSENNLTPRKKPRKQLLEPSSPKNKETDFVCQIKGDLEKETKEQLVIIKKPRPSLLSSVNYQTKSQQHFLRYSDVKQKQDKKSSIQDLINEFKKQNGWKDFHVAEQLKKSSEDEDKTIHKKLENFLQVLEQDISPYSKSAAKSTLYGDSVNSENLNQVDRKCMKINDLTRANIQRSKVIFDHFNECNQLIVKLTNDHKEKINSMTKRIIHKRGCIK